jgi:hypothetical protein
VAAALLALLAPGASGGTTFGAAAPAQAETGRITGTVRDASGATVTEAAIVARGTQTGLTRRTKSGKSGTYTIPNLKAGVYEVTVESEGKDRAMLQVRVSVGTASRLDFTLYPAASQQ